MGGIIDFVEDVVEAVVDVVSNVFKAIGSVFKGIFGGFGPNIPEVNIPEVEASVGAQAVLLTKVGTNEDIPVVYGLRRIGGRVIFVETNGTNSENLYVVYVLCEGEIKGIKEIIVDNNKLPIPSDIYNNFSIQSVTDANSRYKDRLRFQIFTGTETQSQSTLANLSKSWSGARRRLPGVAYVVMEFKMLKVTERADAENNPYGGGLPQVQFTVLGKTTYNCAQLNNTSKTQLDGTDYDDLAKQFSYNPVNHMIDFMMNPRYGAGISASSIDWASVAKSAKKCNQKVDYSATQSGKAITSNIVLSTKAKVLDNLKVLSSGLRGFVPFIQGRYTIKIEDGGNDTDITSATLSSVYDVSEREMLPGVSMSGENKQSKYNQVIVNWVDPDAEFTEQQAVYTESADVTSDGEDLIGEFRFHSINNRAMAENIARMIYKKSRKQRVLAFETTPQLLETTPGDIIRVTNSTLGLSLDTFRIVAMNITPKGNISINAVEHDATFYPYVEGEQIEVAPKTYKPNNYTIVPTQQPVPAVPIQVAPPNDIEDIIVGAIDSGVTESPSTQNNEFPPAPDYKGTLTQFSTSGIITSAVLYNVTGYTFPLDSQGVSIGGQGLMALTINPPSDGNIDRIRFYVYTRGRTDLGPTIQDRVLTKNSDGLVGMLINVDKDGNSYIVPRFYSSMNSSYEYQDTSDGPYSNQSYLTFNNTSASGRTLEAVINSDYQSLSFNEITGTVANLGA